MDSDQGKLFIGGISWETDEEKLKEYFQGYGEVLQTAVMRDKISGKPRGFGFVVFSDPNILDRVLQDRHVIDGRTEWRCILDNLFSMERDFIGGCAWGDTRINLSRSSPRSC